MAFLEILGKAPFPAWRMSGAAAAMGQPRLHESRRRAEHGLSSICRSLDQHVTSQAQKT